MHFASCISRRRAFTLIEVMLAIAIMAVICGTIYQFTGTVLRSSTISIRTDDRGQAFAGLRRLLEAQFAALPNNERGTFIGVTDDGKHGHSDALQVVCAAGNAVLTPDAHGLYQITLGLHETPRGSNHYSLVMEREPWSDSDQESNDPAFKLPPVSEGGLKTNSNQLPSDTVRLLDGVSSLEISYYDPRLNSGQDRWNDDTLIPSLVRVRLGMEDGGAPFEFIEQVPSGGIRRGLPNTVSTNIPLPGTNNIPGVVGPNGQTVPALPPNLTVPPPPPGGFPNVPGGFSPNSPLVLPTGGNPAPR